MKMIRLSRKERKQKQQPLPKQRPEVSPYFDHSIARFDECGYSFERFVDHPTVISSN